MSEPRRSPWFRYGSAVAALVAATLVRYLLDSVLEDRILYTTYYIAIMFSAWYAGLGPSLMTVFVGAPLATYLFNRGPKDAPPSILPQDPDEWLALTLYFVVGITISVLSESLRASRRRAEVAGAQADTSEERLRTVSDYTFDWEYWLDPDGKLLHVSRSCSRITGYGPEEFMARPNLMEAIVHPDDRPRVVERLRESLDGREVLSLEFRILTHEGYQRWIEHTSQPVYSRDNRYQGRRASNRDITDRKRAEKALRDSEKKFQQVAESVREGVWVVDRDTQTSFVSPRMAAMLGYPAEEILGKSMVSFVEGGQAETLKACLLDNSPAAGEPLELPFCRKDGSRVRTSVVVSPLTDEEGNHLGAVASVRETV